MNKHANILYLLFIVLLFIATGENKIDIQAIKEKVKKAKSKKLGAPPVNPETPSAKDGKRKKVKS